MGVSVSTEQVEALAQDGVVCIRGAFERRWLDCVARGIETELKAPGAGFVEQAAGLPGRFVTDYCAAQQIAEFQDFVLHSPAAELAGRLMGAASARFLMDVLWIKEPGTTKPTAWHQDQPYFCVDGHEMCSIWLPIDPVPASVALRFIRGSHRWGKWYRPQLTSGKELYAFSDPGSKWETIPDFDAELDKHEILSWDLAQGDCLVFHALSVHGALGNPQAANRRRVLTTVWFGDDATFGVRPSPPRPLFEGHGLKAGERMESPYFPRIWPAPDTASRRFARDSALRISI